MSVLMTATLRRVYLAPAEEGGDLGGAPAGALDIEARIASTFGDDGSSGENNQDGPVEESDGEDLPDEDNGELPDEDNQSEEGDVTLASALGLDEDKLSYDNDGNVVFHATVDGEKHQVKIADLVKSYQLEGHVNQKSMKLENERREFEQNRDNAYNHLATRLQSASNLVAMAEQSLMQDFQSIDWDTLRMNDPGEFAAMRQFYNERAGQIEAAKNQVAQGHNQLSQEQQQKEAEAKQQFINGEIQKMIVDNPAWSDQTVMAKEVGEIGKFMHDTYGFHPNEIADHMDARLVRLIRDAQAYKSGKQGLQDKKVPDNVPKFRKPNSQNAGRSDMQKARQAKAVKDNIRKTGGSVDSIAAALQNRM